MNLDPEAMKAAMEQMKRLGPERMAEMQRQMQANPDLMRQAMAGPHPPPAPLHLGGGHLRVSFEFQL